MMLMLGLSALLIVIVYVRKQTNGSDSESADYWQWFAKLTIQQMMLLRTLVVVGCLTVVMALMLGTYRH